MFKITSSNVSLGKYLPHVFTIQNSLKQGDASSQLLFNFALEYGIRNEEALHISPC